MTTFIRECRRGNLAAAQAVYGPHITITDLRVALRECTRSPALSAWLLELLGGTPEHVGVVVNGYAMVGDLKVVQYYLRRTPSLSEEVLWNAVTVACGLRGGGHPDVCEALLDALGDKVTNDNPRLHIIVTQCVDFNHVECLDMLDRRGLVPASCLTELADSVASRGRGLDTVKWLLTHGANFTSRNGNFAQFCSLTLRDVLLDELKRDDNIAEAVALIRMWSPSPVALDWFHEVPTTVFQYLPIMQVMIEIGFNVHRDRDAIMAELLIMAEICPAAAVTIVWLYKNVPGPWRHFLLPEIVSIVNWHDRFPWIAACVTRARGTNNAIKV